MARQSWDSAGGSTHEELREEHMAGFIAILDEVEHGLAGVAHAEIPLPPSSAEVLSPKRPASTRG